MNTDLIAYCGLYCGNCKQYKKGKCPSCRENDKFTWCKIRTCCIGNKYKSCVECIDFENPKECKKYNNFLAKIIELFFRSDRSKAISFIRQNNYQLYAEKMIEEGKMSFKK